MSNLANQSTGYTWIYWNWTNPDDADFDHTEVWVNGTFYANVSSPTNYYNTTGLSADTVYEIQTKTADTNNNVKGKLYNLAYEKLKQMIVTGEVSHDKPLVERSISKTLKMSRTPIKHALSRLQQEGLSRQRPFSGDKCSIKLSVVSND